VLVLGYNIFNHITLITMRNSSYYKKKKSNFGRIISLILVLVLVVATYGLGFRMGLGSESGEEDFGTVNNKEDLPDFVTQDVDMDLLFEVWEEINKKYIDAPVSESQLFYGAVAGSVASLGDPYSVFLEPEISREFQEELAGKFEGIGAEIAIKKDRLTIVAPLPDSPALKAGIKAGDKVFTIDSKDTTGISLGEAVNTIRGEKGTKVVLGVMREDNGKEIIDIEIIRDQIKFKSVRWEMKEGDIGYIKVLHFNDDTSKVFDQAARDILRQNPKGIILDLRNNPGGYLTMAIDMASWWIDEDIVVMKQFGKNYNDAALRIDKKEVYGPTLDAKFKGIKTIVLVNGGSASGSEIVAGALQDYKSATLVGETTFGKGSVQELVEYGNGSSLKVTVAKWLTPLGRVIDGEGIEPDVVVELTDEDFSNDLDPQLDKALELLR